MANTLPKNFRQTAAATSLARKLFDPATQMSISPATITQLLNAAGINTPKSLQITADSAQILLAGGAIVSDVDKAANLGSIVTSSVSGIRAFADLAGVIGLADPKSPGMQLMRWGADIAMVLATGGTNVLADIAFVLDIIGAFLGTPLDQIEHQQNDQLNQKKAQAWIDNRLTQQSKYAAAVFQSYQNKKISVFQMLGAVALKSPDLFLNYFPEFKAFIPPIALSQCVSSSQYNFTDQNGLTREVDYQTAQSLIKGGVLGTFSPPYFDQVSKSLKYVPQITTVTDKYCFNFQTIKIDKLGLEKVFIDKYLANAFAPYRLLKAYTKQDTLLNGYPLAAQRLGVFDHRFPVYPRIAFQDLAVLSMFPPYFDWVHDDFDLKIVLKSLGITLTDLGYGDEFVAQMSTGELSSHQPTPEPALTINGMEIFGSEATADLDKSVLASNAEIEKAIADDEAGNIVSLLQSQRANRVITEFGILPYLKNGQELTLPVNYQSLPVSHPLGYRNIRNYWGAVSLMDSMKRDSFFSDAITPDRNLFSEVEGYIPTQEYMDERHRDLQLLIVGRKMNQIAKSNVANYFGTTADKIEFYPPEAGKLAKIKSVRA